MSQDIEFVQLTLKVDGALCNVLLPSDAKTLLVSMLPSFFEDKTIKVYKLPDDVKLVKQSEMEKRK